MTQPTSLADSEKSARRIVILVLLYCIPAFQALLPIIDADIWWHLRTGQWIISNGWVPVQDPFSAYGMGKPWVAYSWLFELFVYGLFKNFGLGGIVVQFIYGLAALVLFVGEGLLCRLFSFDRCNSNWQAISLGRLSLILLACGLATLATPYHYHLYRPIIEYSLQSGAFRIISELQPLFFRTVSEWLVLAMTLVAAFVLGWERSWLPFPTSLLLMSAFLTFQAKRDIWVMALAAAFIISQYQSFFSTARLPFALTRFQITFITAGLMLGIFLMGRHRELSEKGFQNIVAQMFPVGAAEFVSRSKYTGPLYNDLDWGGYLIWSLPNFPVSMDGRTNLHGDERIQRSVATWGGYKGWDSDPELRAAQLILARNREALTSLLLIDPRFELVYEDGIAAVFVPRR